jgi:hypothetical protein
MLGGILKYSRLGLETVISRQDTIISSSRLETTTAKSRNRIKELWVKNKGSFRTAKLFP